MRIQPVIIDSDVKKRMHFDVVHVGIAVTFSYFLRGSFRDTGVVFGVYGHSPREKKIYQNHSKSKLIPLNWCFLTSKSLMSYSSSGCRLCSRLVSCQASSYDLTSWKRIKGFDLFSLKSAKTSHFQKTYQAKTYQAPRNGGAAGCRTSFQLHPALDDIRGLGEPFHSNLVQIESAFGALNALRAWF